MGRSTPELRIGLIGSGYMGKVHASAFRAADSVFELPARPVLEMVADDGHIELDFDERRGNYVVRTKRGT